MGTVTLDWTLATPGDIWVLTVFNEPAPFRFDGEHFAPANDKSSATLLPTSPVITAGERIWPRSTP
jgi:hypothetical protein